jgi:enoyl-[acyl-carrier-protein] reductase (NADH)
VIPGVANNRSIAWGIAKACHDADLPRGITGEDHHVDSGYHAVGTKRPDAPDISLSNSLSRE